MVLTCLGLVFIKKICKKNIKNIDILENRNLILYIMNSSL